VLPSVTMRAGHPPTFLPKLVSRLRTPRPLWTKQPSEGAVEHGWIRQSQGYSIPKIIEESRLLQVNIFHTLKTNLRSVDFSLLLTNVMTIADEVDSQLKQAIIRFSMAAAIAA
jgi:hypothetical protein